MKSKFKKSGLLILLLALICLTSGTTLAFFNYFKTGEKNNEINVGNVTFVYDESKGTEFSITDAMPMDKEHGINQANSYTFSVKSKTTKNVKIDYSVTARVNDNELTEYIVPYVVNSKNEGVTFADGDTSYLDLPEVSEEVVVPRGYVDRVLYTGEIPASQTNYQNNFTFKMWLTGDLNYSPYEFVLKSIIGNTELDFEELKANNQIITSKEYYNLSESDKLLYERIAYVNKENKKLITVSQTAVDNTGFNKTEQYYETNNNEITAKINVYSKGMGLTSYSYVKNSVIGNDPIPVIPTIEANMMITKKAFNSLNTDEQEDYDKVKYVKKDNQYVITAKQVVSGIFDYSDYNETDEVFIAVSADENKKKSLVDVITNKVKTSDDSSIDTITLTTEDNSCTLTFAYDGTLDKNIRYVGSNPCNYVELGKYKTDMYSLSNRETPTDSDSSLKVELYDLATCEVKKDSYWKYCIKQHSAGESVLYRIIGVMNNVKSSDGSSQAKAKLVLNDSFGQYSYDIMNQDSNNWNETQLKDNLNGDFLNNNLNENKSWSYGSNTNIFDYHNVFDSESIDLVDTVEWNIGAAEYGLSSFDLFYQAERSDTHSYNHNSTPTTWTGKIGLIYPSDFIGSHAGTETVSRSSCLTNTSWQSVDDCKISWMNFSNYYTSLTMTPYKGSGSSHYDVDCSSGTCRFGTSNSTGNIYPSLYLKSNVKVLSGVGSITDPYKLGI